MLVRRWISSVAAFVVVVPLASCSGGSSANKSLSITYADVADATRTGGPARLDGSVGAAGNGSVRGTVEGDLSGTGQIVANVVPQTPGAVELRWRDGIAYVRRVAVPGDLTRAGIWGWAERPVAARPWSKRPVSSEFTPLLLAPFAPAELAHQLDTRHMPVDVTLDGSRRKLHPKEPLPLIGVWPRATLDLWVDGRDRVVRVEISSLGRRVLGYDVSYGGSRPDPPVPAPSDIEKPTNSNPVPTGAFATQKAGSTNGVTWSVQRAPATQGDDCWRWVAHPNAKIVAVDARGNRCVAPLSPTDDPSDQAAVLASTDGRGSYDVLVIRLPRNARTVTLTPVSGGQPITSAASGDVFVWVGPTSPKIGFAAITLADGKMVNCGPGSINSPADWRQIGNLQTQISSPWACTTP